MAEFPFVHSLSKTYNQDLKVIFVSADWLEDEKQVKDFLSSMDVIGLRNGRDFDRLEHCPRATQERFFELQFTLAEKTGLPMFLHSRATGGAMVEMLTANRHRFKAGVVHSFDGEADEAAALVALDLYIGALSLSRRALLRGVSGDDCKDFGLRRSI